MDHLKKERKKSTETTTKKKGHTYVHGNGPQDKKPAIDFLAQNTFCTAVDRRPYPLMEGGKLLQAFIQTNG